MATVYYSMAGEGKGHAIRARVLAEHLRQKHTLVLYASRDAYRFLGPMYENTNVTVREIPGLHFKYCDAGHLHLPKTVAGGAHFLGQLGGIIERISADIRREKPALAITDFEPALPRAAQKNGVPFISLNHQHFLVVSDLTSLPVWLQRHAFIMSLVVRGFYSGQRATIVSSFFNPPARKVWHQAKQIGVLLRENVLRARPEKRGHVMAYFRKFASPRIVNALKKCGRNVVVFGLGEHSSEGNLSFTDGGEPEFLERLVTCDALVTTAGNQLVGEALYLGKPVFALPESGNYEQYINAHFLKQSGGGEWSDMNTVEPQDLKTFLDRNTHYKVHPDVVNGTRHALEQVSAFL